MSDHRESRDAFNRDSPPENSRDQSNHPSASSSLHLDISTAPKMFPAFDKMGDEVSSPSCNETLLEPEHDARRSVKRELGPWQIFFIVVSGTISLGFFTDSGKVLSIAGPWGAMTALAIVGCVVVFIMHGILEMTSHWPISNPFVEFVSSFVDPDLGIIIGFAYWLAYSITFATFISATIDLVQYWSWSLALQIPLLNVLLPGTLVAINLMGVKWFGNIEMVAGGMKILLVIGACILMLIINVGGAGTAKIGLEFFNEGFCNDPIVAVNPTVAILVGIPIAAYSFCGVEIVAITALEAARSRDYSPQKRPRFPTGHITWFIFLLYFCGSFLFYLNVPWKDPMLVSFPEADRCPSPVVMIAVINAKIQKIPGLLNGFLIIAVMSAANTSLYVASRALYGLMRGYRSTGSIFQNCLHELGTTNEKGVPRSALLVSAGIFGLWLPLVHSLTNLKDETLQEIMSGMATVAIILVWASQCLAFIRYRKWITKHSTLIKNQFEYLRFEGMRDNEHSRWRTIQPLHAWIGLISCILAVFVLSSASMWERGVSITEILAAWIGPAILLLVWILRKVHSQRWWVELDEDPLVLRQVLNRLANKASGQDSGSKESSRQSTMETPPPE